MTEAVQVSGGSRRQFLKATAAGLAGAALGAHQAAGATKTLTMMHENSFIKTYDEYFQKTLIPAYEKATGVKVRYELLSVGTLQTRLTAVAETGSGPDLTLNFFNWPYLYDEKYLDVSDIAEEAGKKNGGWHESIKEAVIVNGKWKAIPFGNVGQLMNWRTDWFKEAGIDTFPDTWDGLLEAGIKLKANGHPFGFELGHGFGDNHGWLYPLLWSYGAREVEPDGKTVAIDAAETARAVDFCRTFFQKTMVEDVLGWTDPNNNKAYLSEQISCTNNAQSILWAAKRDFPEIGKVTAQSLNPKGPTGQRFHILAPWSHSILKHTPDPQAAKDFLRWLMEPAQVGGWYAAADAYYAPFLHAFDDAPMWHSEPRNIPYRDSLASSHLPGWPAPISRAQSESVAKYVVVDMFAKACAGKSTKEVIAEAAAQLKQILPVRLSMSARTETLPGPAARSSVLPALRSWAEREDVFSWLMILPPMAFLLALVGYPFVYGIWLSLQDRPVAQPGTFVGLANFIADFHDPVFWQVAQNTFVYTIVATILKMIGGLGLALVMNQAFFMKNLVRAVLLLPFIVPTVLSTIAWMWILDPSFSVINWLLVHAGIAKPGPSWLGNPTLAMISLIIVNTWRGLPFYAITLLAGLQTIPPDLYEAATIDGASALDRFRFITLPLLKPVVFIVTMFSVIFTFADFQLVYVLTRGGPANATHLFATYSFDIAMSGGQIGLGASVALTMLPPLALVIVALALYLRRQ